MAEKIRYTRKDLKGPDEFMSALGRAVAWARDNRPRLLLAATAVALVLAGVVGTAAYLRWEDEKATADLWPHLNRAREFLQAPTSADAEKLARLQQFLAAYVNTHPKTKAALYAYYYLGSIAYLRGNYGMSAQAFRMALDKAKDQPDMAYLVRIGLGQAFEANGEMANAAAAYKEAADSASGALRAEARMGQARALAALGRRDDAAAIYRAVIAENPDSPQKEIAELKLSRMG
ncbi:MAG: tetratricopeptide repeat protein [Gemmatimonadota bacterium]